MAHLWSCDWGTSNLRLCLIPLEPGPSLCTISEPLGIRLVHQQWLEAGQPPRIPYFLGHLSRLIRSQEHSLPAGSGSAPLLISGMAASTLGMESLPYAPLPFELSGQSLVVARGYQVQQAYVLISGIAGASDVMRGEETLVLGWAAGQSSRAGWGLLPGTHTKLVHTDATHLRDFHTFMTGELFGLLIQHSILRHSVEAAPSWGASHWEAFQRGATRATESRLLHDLFQIRGRDLLHQTPADLQYAYLSGRLIGEELVSLSQASREGMSWLGGSPQQAQRYRTAWEACFQARPPWTFYPAEDLIFAGHRYIWQQIQPA